MIIEMENLCFEVKQNKNTLENNCTFRPRFINNQS